MSSLPTEDQSANESVRPDTLPLVAFDETGNTGQNLLDHDQPVFALASVHMETEKACALASAAAPPGAAEAKFAALRTSNAGRKRILALLRDEDVSPRNVRLSVYHKPFMVTTKIVDILVETWHHHHGRDLYADASHLGLANLLHCVVPANCGTRDFFEWQAKFVAMVRDRSEETVDRFFGHTRGLRRINTDPEFDQVLRMLEMTRETIDDALCVPDSVALDPAVPAVVQLAAEWSAVFDGPFDLVHDASLPIASSSERLQRLMSTTGQPRVFQDIGDPYAFPLRTPGVRFADSREVPQLQVADIVAGAAATLLRSRIRGADDAFADAIHETGIGDLITCAVWPSTAVTPQDLDADQRLGSGQLDYVIELSSRPRGAPPSRAPTRD